MKSKPRPVHTNDGVVRVDPHPHDAPRGVTFEDPLPEPEARDLRDAGINGRARYSTSSPMVMRRVECRVCGRRGTYYGREDEAPGPDHLCDRCTPTYVDDPPS